MPSTHTTSVVDVGSDRIDVVDQRGGGSHRAANLRAVTSWLSPSGTARSAASARSAPRPAERQRAIDARRQRRRGCGRRGADAARRRRCSTRRRCRRRARRRRRSPSRPRARLANRPPVISTPQVADRMSSSWCASSTITRSWSGSTPPPRRQVHAVEVQVDHDHVGLSRRRAGSFGEALGAPRALRRAGAVARRRAHRRPRPLRRLDLELGAVAGLGGARPERDHRQLLGRRTLRDAVEPELGVAAARSRPCAARTRSCCDP